MSVPEFEQLALEGLTDEQLVELLEDLYGPLPEAEPELLLGYARPATRRPADIDPLRPIVDVPPIDTYDPAATDQTRTP
ncbi:hypothetical protein ACIQPP_05430 [Streptomyces violaceusniger]|uniref:hypothetical protein n=1 Tax=Streptomyces violaceusniger TaxID=68280 RepID=UPI0009981109|nr:hypothetical protein [Streptomyces hygroscopicus]AQW55262.1 hypothetical protein SHXM_08725 [Streptomyces hygroscopicus]